jgi:hypothetical protein
MRRGRRRVRLSLLGRGPFPFNQIPLPSSAADRTGVLLEMAAQLGDESALSLSLAASPAGGAGSGSAAGPSTSRGALIPRARFVRVRMLVQMEDSHFPELMRKNALHQTLEQIQMQREAQRTANRSGEWEQDSVFSSVPGAGTDADNAEARTTTPICTSTRCSRRPFSGSAATPDDEAVTPPPREPPPQR